mgnify:CR=1 FL=1
MSENQMAVVGVLLSVQTLLFAYGMSTVIRLIQTIVRQCDYIDKLISTQNGQISVLISSVKEVTSSVYKTNESTAPKSKPVKETKSSKGGARV